MSQQKPIFEAWTFDFMSEEQFTLSVVYRGETQTLLIDRLFYLKCSEALEAQSEEAFLMIIARDVARTLQSVKDHRIERGEYDPNVWPTHCPISSI